MTTRDTAWAPGTPCWDELMSDDLEAARAFYGELLGWRFDVGGPETGGYSVAMVRDRAVAGIGARQGDAPIAWLVFLATDDLDATLDRVAQAGGTIIVPATDVMDLGRMAVIVDPTGAAVALWQAGTMIGTGLANEPGAPIWNEVMTRDFDAAKEFYAALFGYTYTDMSGDGFRYATIEVDGNTVGGLGQLPDEVPAEVPAHWRVYYAVEDTDKTVELATQLGGAVRRAAEDMPYGRFADLTDRDGAGFTVITPPPQA